MKHCDGHDELISDVKEIKSDVKDLLSFKSKILGAIAIVSFFATFIFNFVLKHS